MKRLSIIILVFLFSVIPAFSQTDFKSVLNEAYRLRQENKCEEAINKINKALETESKEASLYIERAECFKLEKNNEEVIKDVRTAFSLDRNTKWLLEKGEFLLRSIGQYQENIALADTIIAENKSVYVYTAYQNRAINKFILKDYAGALEDSIKAGEITPLAQGYRWGLIFDSLKALDNSENVFKFYDLVFGSYDKTLDKIRSEKVQSGSNAKAKDVEKQSAMQQLGPSLQFLSTKLADLYEERHQPEKAAGVLNKMVQIEPKLTAYEYRLNYYLRKGKLEEADKDRVKLNELKIEEITERIANMPSPGYKAKLLIERGDLYISAKQYNQAIADYEIAVTFDKNIESKAAEKIALAKQKIQ